MLFLQLLFPNNTILHTHVHTQETYQKALTSLEEGGLGKNDDGFVILFYH